MCNRATIFCFFLFVLFTMISAAQDTTLAEVQDSVSEKKLQINGYIKDLQTLTFDNGFKNAISSNLIHNRINLKWKPVETLTAAFEVRNRMFWGEEIKVTPGFTGLLKNENEAVDLSVIWISNNNLVLHTNVERLWIEYYKEKWNLRAGRQRLNWGITTLWNPNDLFNTFNFLDFDYEERLGADALKGQYHLTNTSNLEGAVAVTGNNKTIGAVKLFTNKWNYDFQLISGWYYQQFTIGAGWAGSIKDAGFKGELMYFAPHLDSASQFNASLESDYTFAKGWYINAGGLLNYRGLNEPVDWKQLDFQLSPKNLLPVKWAIALTVGKELDPLLFANVTTVYSPGVNLFILLPGLKYNLATNLDVDLVWQSFFAEENSKFSDVGHKGFLRLKWSF